MTTFYVLAYFQQLLTESMTRAVNTINKTGGYFCFRQVLCHTCGSVISLKNLFTLSSHILFRLFETCFSKS